MLLYSNATAQPLALERRFFASFRSEETSMSLLSAAPHPCSAVGSKINVSLAGSEQLHSNRYSYAPCTHFSGLGRFYKGNLHCHSTDSDGSLSWRELADMYRRAGYSFLGFSEHEKFCVHSDDGGYGDFFLVPCVEWSASLVENGDLLKTHHVLGVAGIPSLREGTDVMAMRDGDIMPFMPFRGAESAEEMAAYLRERGLLAIYNHPRWSRITPEDVGPLSGYAALEVYNHNCEMENHTGYGDGLWDYLLSCGVRVNAVAGDDNHNAHGMPDSFGGWIAVYARECSFDSIMTAISVGAYYSSCGPEIFEFGIRGDEVFVECSPVEAVRFVAGGVAGAGSVVRGCGLTNARMTLSGREQYLRIECVDKQGRTAWSNPIYSREFSV